MSNKYPQYMTPDGFRRSKKRPAKKSLKKVEQEKDPQSVEHKLDQLSLKTTAAKRVLRKRRMIKQNSAERTISPAAAKAIAEALKGLLHS